MTAGGPTTGRDDEALCGDCEHPCGPDGCHCPPECAARQSEPAPAVVADNAGEESRVATWREGAKVRFTSPVRPRPAASPGGQADECPVCVGNGVDCPGGRSCQRADDGRTEELREAYRWMERVLDNVGAFDGSNNEARDREYVATQLAPLLAATTARGDDGAVQRVLAAADQFELAANSPCDEPGMASAYQEAADAMRAAVAGGQDAGT